MDRYMDPMGIDVSPMDMGVFPMGVSVSPIGLLYMILVSPWTVVWPMGSNLSPRANICVPWDDHKLVLICPWTVM